MKKKILNACVIFMIIVSGIAIIRWYHVRTCLMIQEVRIKKSMLAAQKKSPPGIWDNLFLEKGKLVFEPTYLIHPEKIYNLGAINVRIYPWPVSREGNSGWVGKGSDGSWHAKLCSF